MKQLTRQFTINLKVMSRKNMGREEGECISFCNKMGIVNYKRKMMYADT